MLTELSIRDFALIESLRLQFGPGLTVLTGETGAGKSIIVGALSLLLGGRFDADTIRTGAESAQVEARLTLSPELAEHCRSLGIDVKPDAEPELILRRRVERVGRGACYANDSILTLSTLQCLGDQLLDLHGQHQHQFLLKPDVHLDILDAYAGLAEERRQFGERFRAHEQLRAELNRLDQELAERRRRRELTEFQAKELSEAGVRPEELSALQQERRLLETAERRHALAYEVKQLLTEGEASAHDFTAAAEKALTQLCRIDERLTEYRSRLTQARELIDEVSRQLATYCDTLDYSAQRLDAVNARLFQIERLERKYGVAAAELPALAQRLQDEIASIETDSDRRQTIAAQLDDLRSDLIARACRLSEQRLRSRSRLESQTHEELAAVGLASAQLIMSIQSAAADDSAHALTERGWDTAEFLFAANPGEEPRPLRKVASGGELSRIMLALKTVLTNADPVPTLVFDELDTGIGGRIADAVGARLARLSQTRQVICITHLPQIARYASRHFLVEKTTRGGRTRTRVRELDDESRVLELARMAGGAAVTRATIAHAREMLRERRL